MRRYLLIFLFLLFAGNVRANHGEPDPHQYPFNMNVIGVIEINGIELATEGFEVGAFCGDECRGSEILTFYEGLGRYLVFMTIYGQSGDVFSFKLYDHSTQRELELTPPETLPFTANAIVGALHDPFVISFSGGMGVITANAVPEAGGTITGGGAYWIGETCTLYATANEGYTFVDWTENGQQVSTESTLSIFVMESHDLQANFSVNSYEVAVEAQPEEGGTVAGSGIYDYGTTVTVSASPNEHYEFVNWTENGVMVSNSAEYTFTLDGDRHLVANFGQESFTVSATVLPANAGSIEGVGNYVYGQTAILTARPNANYAFLEWTENGAFVSNQPSISFAVTQDRHFEAYFSYYDGIEEEESAVSVFPNPTTGMVVIEGMQEGSEIRVVNGSGNLVLMQRCEGSNAFVDLDFLPNGCYCLVITKGQKTIRKRVVIVK